MLFEEKWGPRYEMSTILFIIWLQGEEKLQQFLEHIKFLKDKEVPGCDSEENSGKRLTREVIECKILMLNNLLTYR